MLSSMLGCFLIPHSGDDLAEDDEAHDEVVFDTCRNDLACLSQNLCGSRSLRDEPPSPPATHEEHPFRGISRRR